MNILQTVTTRKLSEIKELSPGKGGGGTPPQEMTSINNEQRRENWKDSEIEAFFTSLSFLNEPTARIRLNHRRNSRRAP
jgi:hypothetical protein